MPLLPRQTVDTVTTMHILACLKQAAEYTDDQLSSTRLCCASLRMLVSGSPLGDMVTGHPTAMNNKPVEQRKQTAEV